jgi:hypothetical protein
MSWYNQGYNGMKQEEDRQATANGPDRLWIPAESSKEIIFVDDEPFCVYEHNPKIDGDFKNWLTCLKGIEDEIACCEIIGAKTRYFVGFYTVIDCSSYTDKKGNTHQFQLKFLPAKMKTLKKLKRKREDKKGEAQVTGLAGMLYKATRDDKKSPTVGDDFEFVRQVDMEKVFTVANYRGKKLTELWSKANTPETIERLQKVFQAEVVNGSVNAKLVPFNYMELLKPQTAKEVRARFKGVKIESWDDEAPTGGSNSGSAGADEGVPF